MIFLEAACEMQRSRHDLGRLSCTVMHWVLAEHFSRVSRFTVLIVKHSGAGM